MAHKTNALLDSDPLPLWPRISELIKNYVSRILEKHRNQTDFLSSFFCWKKWLKNEFVGSLSGINLKRKHQAGRVKLKPH